jgi:hypothetical protein
MFFTLFLKECKQILKSLVYYIFIVLFVLDMVGQMSGGEVIKEPQAGEEIYGVSNTKNPEEIMGYTLRNLVNEVRYNSFATYPMGFYKEVILNETDLAFVTSVAENLAGKTIEELTEEEAKYFENLNIAENEMDYAFYASYSVKPKNIIEYDYFKAEMNKISEIIGDGNYYEKERYEASAVAPMTYEEVMIEFHAICEEDGITDAFMRLFCDYGGINLTLLVIFLGVTRSVRDKRTKVQEVIYAKQISSIKIVLSRYAANVVMAFIPVILLAFIMQASYLYQAQTLGVTPHYFAFLFYSVMWLLPTILVVLAVSFFITELLNGIIAIIFQVFWALASLMSSVTLAGNFGLKLIPRWNLFGGTLDYIAIKNELYFNRIFYVVLSIVTLILCIIIYDYKRKGGIRFTWKKV